MGRKIQNASFATTEATPRFRPFTASELAKLTTELEYGDNGIIDSMFEERI
jgi:AMMECR1 domain-containing protein